MKHLRLCVLLVAFIGVQCASAQKKEFKTQLKKEVSFNDRNADNLLIINNVFGSISVTGYEGSTIQVSVEKTITAKNVKDLELGKQEIGLKVVKDGNKIVIHPDAPYIDYKEGHLKFNWCNGSKNPPYEHNLNFIVKIPKNIKLEVSTVNNGEVLVANTRGIHVKANNINGGIVLKNITGQTEVHAINGEVQVSYAINPPAASTYYALNGDINITYQKDLSADIAFKSMNGELFTDFDIEKQYAKTNKMKSGKKGGIRYKYESKPIIQIGSGKLHHDFETLNGDVIIKKI